MKPTRLFYLVLCLLILGSLLLAWNRAEGQTTPNAPEVEIDGRETRQQIDGFGAAFAWQAGFFKDFPEPGRTEILDLLFSQQNGAGLSIVRSMIQCSTDRTYPEFMTISPEEGVWEFDHDTGQIEVMQEAKARGTTRFFSSVWSPPPWMKTNNNCANVILEGVQSGQRPLVPVRGMQPAATNQTDTRGRLDPSKRQAFADYLSRYVREYKARFGLDMYAISIANEPEFSAWYDSALWTPEELRVFIRDYLVPTFARDGVQARVIIPETGPWSEVEEFAGPTLRDEEAAPGVHILAGHAYAGAIRPIDEELLAGRHVWQTESSNIGADNDTITDTLRWAREIHDFMVVAESNAWLWWWGVLGFESGGNYTGGEGLIYFKTEDASYRVAKRLYGIGNFSRFVRPGYLRIAATPNPSDGVYVSAYKDPATQRFVAVVLNTGSTSQTVSVAVNHLPVQAVTPYVTSATQNLAPQPALPLASGTFTATLDAKSVTTFVSAGSPDLYLLQEADSSTALSILSGVNSLQTTRESLPTTLPVLGDLAGWSFTLADATNDGALDLYAVGTNNTTSGLPELHILDGADSFRSFLGHHSLTLPTQGGAWTFEVADANGDNTPDLYAIGVGGTTSGQTELHILDGSDSFESFLAHSRLALPEITGTTWRFGLADANGDGSPDLYAISIAISGQTTLRILDGTDAYRSTLTDVPIDLPLPASSAWRFGLADANGDGIPDLYAIDPAGVPTVRLLDGANRFQTPLTVDPISLPLAGSGPSRVFLLGRR